MFLRFEKYLAITPTLIPCLFFLSLNSPSIPLIFHTVLLLELSEKVAVLKFWFLNKKQVAINTGGLEFPLRDSFSKTN